MSCGGTQVDLEKEEAEKGFKDVHDVRDREQKKLDAELLKARSTEIVVTHHTRTYPILPTKSSRHSLLKAQFRSDASHMDTSYPLRVTVARR